MLLQVHYPWTSLVHERYLKKVHEGDGTCMNGKMKLTAVWSFLSDHSAEFIAYTLLYTSWLFGSRCSYSRTLQNLVFTLKVTIQHLLKLLVIFQQWLPIKWAPLSTSTECSCCHLFTQVPSSIIHLEVDYWSSPFSRTYPLTLKELWYELVSWIESSR